MTGARFQQLKNGTRPKDSAEAKEFRELLQWERRSTASKQAVVTKRQKYKTWPTKKKDHN